MTSRGNSRITSVLGGALLGLALAGCGPILIPSRPDTFELPVTAGELLNGQGSIVLNNAYKAETRATIFDAPRDWVGDLEQYTQSALFLLERGLENNDIEIAPQAARSVTLRVFDVQYINAVWVKAFSLALEAQTGDGQSIVIRVQNKSPADVWRALDGAIMRAVESLLRDERFVAYVNG